QIFRSKGPLQEVDHGFSTQRMQIRLDIRRSLPLVVPFTAGCDVPEVAGAVSYYRRTLTVGLIHRRVDGRRACLQRPFVNRVAIANGNVECSEVRIASPGQTSPRSESAMPR